MLSSQSASKIMTRQCGTCMLCCKLPAIDELSKPENQWCKHAKPGKGCAIYGDRPQTCRAFLCEWITDPDLNDNWKPDRAKFFVRWMTSKQFMISVDPGFPNAWKASQYYPPLKLMATRITDQGGYVMVGIGARRILILPDRDEDLGSHSSDTEIQIDRLMVGDIVSYQVRISKSGEAQSN